MTNSKTTKRALLSSVLAIVLCLTMLIGTTFAWFTDTASTGVNKIQAGNLDIDIVDGNGNSLDGKTLSFKNVDGETDILWEPGARYNLDSFKIVNKGNLALKYEVTINGVSGDAKLLEAIDFTVTKGNDASTTLDGWRGVLLPKDATPADANTEEVGETSLITIKGVMRTDAGNEYQGLSLDSISITVVATQYTYESDSFNNEYDKDAKAEINVNTSNIQDYLDGKYGSINGMTLVLAAGEYDALTIGGVTADTKDNLTYTCNHTDGKHYSFNNLSEYKAHLALTGSASSDYHWTSTYTRTMSNVTFVAAGDVTINGMTATSGGYMSIGNPFRENSDGYYLNQKLTNFTFSGIKFSGNVNINTSSADTVIDGFTFDNCTFTTNGTTEDKGQAIRYYNENNNGQVKNLVVKDCTFTNCYQAVYTMQVRGVSVTGSKFNTIGHNAIAVQSQGENVNHGVVVITGNEFKAVSDRIIRFNNVGADTQITIQNNTATNSGNSNNEVIKATTLATGITYNISGNDWGTGVVGNNEFADK